MLARWWKFEQTPLSKANLDPCYKKDEVHISYNQAPKCWQRSMEKLRVQSEYCISCHLVQLVGFENKLPSKLPSFSIPPLVRMRDGVRSVGSPCSLLLILSGVSSKHISGHVFARRHLLDQHPREPALAHYCDEPSLLGGRDRRLHPWQHALWTLDRRAELDNV